MKKPRPLQLSTKTLEKKYSAKPLAFVEIDPKYEAEHNWIEECRIRSSLDSYFNSTLWKFQIARASVAFDLTFLKSGNFTAINSQ